MSKVIGAMVGSANSQQLIKEMLNQVASNTNTNETGGNYESERPGKIIGATVGTTTSPAKMKEELKPVTSINGIEADENGNVDLPVYDGAFSVTPSAVNEITLLTAQTFMDSDIKVEKIPYAEVTNHSGGKTATIGGN